MAFIPDSPVGFPTEQRVAYSIWMGRPEQRDANGLAGIALGGCWPVGREPLIATVRLFPRSGVALLDPFLRPIVEPEPPYADRKSVV